MGSVGFGACGQKESVPAAELAVAVDTSRGIDSAFVVLTGLSSRELDEWRARPSTSPQWAQSFRVSVAGVAPTIAGKYVVSDTALEFHPMFALDPGRAYDVIIDARQLSSGRQTSSIRQSIVLPARRLEPPTRVLRVLPGFEPVPENLLRLYVEFSAPMSREPGIGFVHLLNDKGVEVSEAFLPVDGDFWNHDRTRYTLFLDPGRVKRGIQANEEMGRALRSGRRYTLRIDSTWRDGRGMPLVAPFDYSFRVGPAEFRPIKLAEWRVSAPPSKSSKPLVVRFPTSLDHGLLHRALGVETADGAAVDGRISTHFGERTWQLVPASPWQSGPYRLVVLSILEDVAGNRINRRFEVDRSAGVDSLETPARFTIPFVIP